MREDYHLVDLVDQPAHLLNGCERSVLIEARHRIIDNDNLMSQPRVLFKRCKEKCECQSITIARAQSAPERRTDFSGRTQSDRHIVDYDAVGAGRALPGIHRG